MAGARHILVTGNASADCLGVIVDAPLSIWAVSQTRLRGIADQGNGQGCPLARRVRAKDNRELVPLVKRGTS